MTTLERLSELKAEAYSLLPSGPCSMAIEDLEREEFAVAMGGGEPDDGVVDHFAQYLQAAIATHNGEIDPEAFDVAREEGDFDWVLSLFGVEKP